MVMSHMPVRQLHAKGYKKYSMVSRVISIQANTVATGTVQVKHDTALGKVRARYCLPLPSLGHTGNGVLYEI